jgi:hypothetical protein
MRIQDVTSYRNRLDQLFKRVGELKGDIELQSHFARYLCVLVSGFIEVATKSILAEYARGKGSPELVNFIENHLDDFQNAKMEKILSLTKLFNPSWESTLRTATEGELKDAVDSIVANRHKIAHGESVGITYARVSQYYEKVEKVVDLLAQQCGVDI